ncbi:MAG: BatA domain-containing protein [Bacteroidia bacterium]
MQFLYPQFLFALFGLAIPIIIHLFNFRRFKKVYFSQVKFLTAVQKEQKAKNKLKHLLVLAARMLAIAAAVIAFAHPYIPQKNKLVNPGKKYISVYIDNSFSMSNTGANGELLQLAKKNANEIAQNFSEGDDYNLVTNDFEGRHQRWVSKAEFLRLVDEINVSPSFRTLPEVYKRLHENFRQINSTNKAVYLVSDFQKNMLSEEELKPDTSLQAHLLPLKASRQNNIYIDSVWFDNALWQIGQSNTLSARIINASGEAVDEGTIALTINGKQKAIANFSIGSDANTTVKLTYTVTDAGFNKGVLSLDDYPITFDNSFYFSYDVIKTLPVLIINGKNSNESINKAFSAEKAYAVTNVSQGNIDFSSLPNYKFIILNELDNVPSGLSVSLQDFLQKGGNVLFIPSSATPDLPSYNNFLALQRAGSLSNARDEQVVLSAIDAKQPFFTGIFEEVPRNIAMPKVSKYYPIATSGAGAGMNLLSLQNGNPFITITSSGKGMLFTSAAPFNETWSTFTQHSLFLPVLYKMSLYGSFQAKIYNIIGKDNYLQAPAANTEKENIFKLVKDSFEVIPPHRMVNGNPSLFVENLITEAGHYGLDASADNASAAVYSFNYNRNESQMQFMDADELEENTASLQPRVLSSNNNSVANQLQEIEQGAKMWKWFILAALLFLLAETLLIRFWKS